MNWFRTGGIPSVAQAIQDTNRKELALHGPPKLVSNLNFLMNNLIANVPFRVE